MSVIPRSGTFFDMAGVLLRADASASHVTPTEWQMELDEALSYVDALGRYTRSDDQSARSFFLSPLIVSFLGGEPLARPDALQQLLERANSYEMVGEIWTTGAWVTNLETACEVLGSLRGKVHALRLHTNAEMFQGRLAEQIGTLIQAARRVQVTLDVRCGVAPELPVPIAMLGLEAVNNDASFIHAEPAHDRLRHEADDPDGFYLSVPPPRRCAEKYGFYIAPGGLAYPCLQGAGFGELSLGNLAVESVQDIVARIVADDEIIALRQHGPRPLFDILDTAARAQLSGRYVDACDFHRQLMESRQLAKKVFA